MKVFISWSGNASLNVATTLKSWLPYLFNGIELFVSSEDVRKGKRWLLEVSKELGATNFGIVCLTPGNLEASWILFEAGALSKSLNDASVYTLLLGGLRASDIDGPLSHFQHTLFEKDDFFKLVISMNESSGAAKQEVGRLKKIYEKFWDELQTEVTQALKKAEPKSEKKRSQDDMLRDILDMTNYIARNIKPAKNAYVTRPSSRTPLSDLIVTTEGEHQEFWKAFVEKIGKASPFVRAYFVEAIGGYFGPDSFTIFFSPESKDHIPLVNNDKNRKLIKQTLESMGYSGDVKIEFAIDNT